MTRLRLDISVSLDGFVAEPAVLECTRMVEAPGATHLRYRVVR